MLVLIVHFATSVFCPLSVHIWVEMIYLYRARKAPSAALCASLRPVCRYGWAVTLCGCCACPGRVLAAVVGLSDPLTFSPAKITPHPLGGSRPGSVPVASPVPLSGSACPPRVFALLLSLRGSVARPVALWRLSADGVGRRHGARCPAVRAIIICPSVVYICPHAIYIVFRGILSTRPGAW